MKNLLIIGGGILAWFLYKYRKGLIISNDTLTDSDKETELNKEKVREVVKVPTKNNLGIVRPDIDYLQDPIEYLRTNKAYDVKSDKVSMQVKKPSIVREVFTRFQSSNIGVATKDQINQIYSRVSMDPVAKFTVDKSFQTYKPIQKSFMKLY